MLIFHAILGFVAIITGALNLLTRKGTQQHRYFGWTYTASMGGLILSSFAIYNLFGGFGPFHVMSLISGVSLALAIYYPLRRKKYRNWLIHHYMWISWSYIGLIMATGSHLFGYIPKEWPVWIPIILFWILPCGVGTYLIYTHKNRLLSRFS